MITSDLDLRQSLEKRSHMDSNLSNVGGASKLHGESSTLTFRHVRLQVHHSTLFYVLKIFLKKRLDKPQPSFPPVSPLMTVNCRSDSFSSDLQNLVTIAIDLQRKNKQLNCTQLCNFSLRTRVMSTQEGTTFCLNEIV